jgi:hypothetical protein
MSLAAKEILYNKDAMLISKLKEGCFQIDFQMENRNILLANVINFDLLKLIYDLNKDIVERVEMNKIDENNAIITILVKNFFEDLGIPQKFACLQVLREENSETKEIQFTFNTFPTYRASWLASDIELAFIDQIKLICVPASPHLINFHCWIQFPMNKDIPAFVQKMSVMMVQKIINRLKQFIESVKIYI